MVQQRSAWRRVAQQQQRGSQCEGMGRCTGGGAGAGKLTAQPPLAMLCDVVRSQAGTWHMAGQACVGAVADRVCVCEKGGGGGAQKAQPTGHLVRGGSRLAAI